MRFNELLKLSKEQAQSLFQQYCEARDDYLLKLSEVAARLGVSLPQHADGYRREHLTTLGSLVPAILSNRAICRTLPKTPEWLVDLFDTGSSAKDFTEAQVWVGVGCSYAFQSIVLNTRNDVRLAIGDRPIRRYNLQNQPVVTGSLYGADEPLDASPLTVGYGALWRLKEREYTADYFVATYRMLAEGAERWQPPKCE